jgi:hypothetical protein
MTSASSRSLQLELELDQARRHGRWLSDEERAELAHQQRRQDERLAQQRLHRRKLAVLMVVCLLIPPFWPLALGLALYLLFPVTTRRLALATGISLLALGGLFAVLLTALVVALLLAIF